MVRTKKSIRSAVEALASREPAFARVIELHGIPEPRSSDPGVQTLLRTIVGQQVSVAAARSMWAKLESAFGSPPAAVKRNNTKLVQGGTLLTGESIGQYLDAHGGRARLVFRNDDGSLAASEFER